MSYLADKSGDWSPGYNLSESPEEVFRRGKGGARIYTVKNYKPLMKDTNEGLRKRRDTMCSWVERLNTVKMFISSKNDLRIWLNSNLNPIRNFFCSYSNTGSKIYMEKQLEQSMQFWKRMIKLEKSYYLILIFIIKQQ